MYLSHAPVHMQRYIELIAEKAVNSLIDIINNKNTEKEIILPITYINGSTTKR